MLLLLSIFVRAAFSLMRSLTTPLLYCDLNVVHFATSRLTGVLGHAIPLPSFHFTYQFSFFYLTFSYRNNFQLLLLDVRPSIPATSLFCGTVT